MGEESNRYRVLMGTPEGVDGRIGSEWILRRLAGGV
jgi:hypothetical protein